MSRLLIGGKKNYVIDDGGGGDPRTPSQKRQLDGFLNRVPTDFYRKVWTILERTKGGVMVSGCHLPQVCLSLHRRRHVWHVRWHSAMALC